MKSHSERFIKRRKFYMMLPVLVIPFMTMFFWAVGGGRGTEAPRQASPGLNTSLPGPKLNDNLSSWDKLALYQKAVRDSVKSSHARRTDPYWRLRTLESSGDTAKRDSTKHSGSIKPTLGRGNSELEDTEAKVYEKLSTIQKLVETRDTGTTRKAKKSHEDKEPRYSGSDDIDRLENMMLLMQNDPGQDQEMQEINGVLNKILDIQHPERVQQRFADRPSEVNSSHVVSTATREDIVGALSATDTASTRRRNKFYGLDELVSAAHEENAIEAEIYGNQTLVNGSVIKIELLQDIKVNGLRIPKNQFVYGECAVNGDRLKISVSSIHYGNSILPVSLAVYDIDGVEGVNVPGALARDAAKRSSNQATQGLQISSFDPSLEVQAANAGIEAAKGFISRKTRLVQVTVKAGYKIFLKDKNTKNDRP